MPLNENSDKNLIEKDYKYSRGPIDSYLLMLFVGGASSRGACDAQ
jgi:hypothetical protein